MTAADVAVVGGGFTGAVFAIHLSRLAERPLDVAIVEPRERPGRGVAYDTADPDHRLNAPLPIHFVYPDAPGHLPGWYAERGGPERDPEALGPDGTLYPRRGEFGRYVEEQLRSHSAGNASGSTIRHIWARALSARRSAAGYRLDLTGGQALDARLVVIAAGYERPRAPPPFAGTVSGHPGFVADPWDTDRLGNIPADARVLVLGMSQTASDAIAVLLRNGHGGPITAVARRGLLPRRKPETAAGLPPDIVDRIGRPVSLFTEAHGRHGTALSLLRTLRGRGAPGRSPRAATGSGPSATCATRSGRSGRPCRWRRSAASCAICGSGTTPTASSCRRRSRRALPGRKPPGSCRSRPPFANLLHATATPCPVTLRRRGSGDRRRERFGAVVNCTGPDLRPDRSDNPLIASLAARGYAAAHPTGIGFDVDGECRALGAGGRPDPHLRIVGPLTYGAFADQQGAPFIALRLCAILPGIAAALRR